MDPVKKNMKTYNEIAEEYCEKTEKGGNREFQKEMLDRTVKFLSSKPRMIDLGCGDGRDTEYLREKGVDVVGIDISSSMIDLAREKYPECAFFRSDIRDTIFPEDTFTGAWASTTLSNLPKKELSKAEKEIYRIVEPGGIIGFSFKVGEKEGFEESVIEGHERYYSYYTLEELKIKFNLFDIIDSKKCPDKIFGDEFMYCWGKARK